VSWQAALFILLRGEEISRIPKMGLILDLEDGYGKVCRGKGAGFGHSSQRMSRFDIADAEKVRRRLKTLSDRDLNEFGRVLLKNCRPETSRAQPLSRSETLLEEALQERRRRKPAEGKLNRRLPFLQPKV
jgi:hypothetical protein